MVAAEVKEMGSITTVIDATGAYRLSVPAMGKEVSPKAVTISHSKAGDEQARTFTRTNLNEKPHTAVEVECTLQPVGAKGLRPGARGSLSPRFFSPPRSPYSPVNSIFSLPVAVAEREGMATVASDGERLQVPVPWIYQLDGDMLRLRGCGSLGQPRAPDFASPPGSPFFTITYQRQRAP
jgi:hypothetical protein